jgi:hypothetical protein
MIVKLIKESRSKAKIVLFSRETGHIRGSLKRI